MEWIKQIEKYNPVNEQEKKDKDIMLDFINKNDVHFNETRANEDNGFNRLLFLLSNNNIWFQDFQNQA